MEIQRARLRARLAERDVSLNLSEEALDYLEMQGYDPAYGAWPLKRLIQKELEDRIALALLRGDIGDGDAPRFRSDPPLLVPAEELLKGDQRAAYKDALESALRRYRSSLPRDRRVVEGQPLTQAVGDVLLGR